jgi:hypothetical protein
MHFRPLHDRVVSRAMEKRALKAARKTTHRLPGPL